ncbi:MAG: tRNA adenosine(34) deaminase TadA [Bowdeniella nasicola]|nr:tRNA adenosine(34) deaminase TadA [Bowdeniella nasicola]
MQTGRDQRGAPPSGRRASSDLPGWVEYTYGAAMGRALGFARHASAAGEVPIGAAVVTADGVVVGTGHNRRERDHDPTAHAEILALRSAGRTLGTSHLDGCTLVVTVEPCTMCAGAAVLARVERIVFGAWEPKTGACGSLRDVPRDTRATHRCEVIGGLRADECAALMESFFRARRHGT